MGMEIQSTVPFTQVFAYSGNNIEYIGNATPGSTGLKANAIWQIRKLIYDGNNIIDILWADGNMEFDNIWNNRTGLSYS